jgi:hypothetical protein
MNQINQLKHNSAHYFEGTCAVNFFNCLILIIIDGIIGYQRRVSWKIILMNMSRENGGGS